MGHRRAAAEPFLMKKKGNLLLLQRDYGGMLLLPGVGILLLPNLRSLSNRLSWRFSRSCAPSAHSDESFSAVLSELRCVLCFRATIVAWIPVQSISDRSSFFGYFQANFWIFMSSQRFLLIIAFWM